VNTRAKIAFAAISILWGIPYPLIKIAVDAGITSISRRTPSVIWASV